jgi:hypothetical protein
VLLGDGSGGFSPAPDSPFAAGSSPFSIAVGDFNGDGTLDLVTANPGSGNATVLLGNGSGWFNPAPGSPFAVGAGPNWVAVGDFNRDGNLDLAIANSGPILSCCGGTVTVLLGNGSGGFSLAPGSPLVVGSVPVFVAVGDFNGDGKPDLAVVNGSVTVLLGDGSGGFSAAPGSPVPAGNYPNFVAVGDLNGDGIPDLAVTCQEGCNDVTVLLGSGTGGFSPASGSPFTVGANSFSVAVGDFNGDGKPDLAVAVYSVGGVTVLLGGMASTSSSLSTTSPLNITSGQSVPLTLTVSDTTTAFNAPTGTATFLDGATCSGRRARQGAPTHSAPPVSARAATR